MRRKALILGVLLLLPAMVAPVLAEQQEFLKTGHFQLKAFGEIDPAAEIYIAKSVASVLVISEKLQKPVLIVAGEKKATALDEEAVTPVPDRPDAVLVDVSKTLGRPLVLKIVGRDLSFIAGGKRVIVQPSDPILGDVSPEQLLARIPELRRGKQAYVPRTGQMRLLGELQRHVRLLVFMGSWCPHCEQLVPRLLRVAEDLPGHPLEVTLRLVPRNMSGDILARQYRVHAVPTVVVIENDKEIARLEGDDLKRPEAGLTRVLFGS